MESPSARRCRRLPPRSTSFFASVRRLDAVSRYLPATAIRTFGLGLTHRFHGDAGHRPTKRSELRSAMTLKWTVSTEGDAITSGLRPRFPGRSIGTAALPFEGTLH